MPVRRPKSNKNPPILSHEFIIQNHADIVSCVAMVFVIGLMFQATSPVASLFVAIQHNVTMNNTENQPGEVTWYTYGLKDLCTAAFYFLICIVIHAVVQEYILDKLNRKMHLSKVKHSKFNESGQLLVFYAISAGWGIDLIIKENYVANIASLWEDYPHAYLPFLVKFYYIIQLAYWIHSFPELYFQKIKKEEMSARIQYTVLYLIFISLSYMLNFTRVGLCMLVPHFLVEMVFHFARLLYFADKQESAKTGFFIWNILFVLVRLGTITLAVLTFWYGLAKTGQTSINFSEGNFNIHLVRICCLCAVCFLQAWMMWNFITFHLRHLRERSQAISTKKVAPQSTPKDVRKRKGKGKSDDEGADSTGDPGTPTSTENGSVRARSVRGKQRQ